MLSGFPRALFNSLILGILAATGESPAQPPNIIFILADDLGYGDLGVFWQNSRTGTRIRTPQLDQMAAAGTILNQHYAPAPVCAPSRASLISGMHQGHANVRDNQFDKALEDNYNFANTLRTAGYYTALVGKYGLQGSGANPTQWAAYPTKRGFDYFYGYVRHADGHQHYPANTWPLGDSPTAQSPKELWENNSEVSSGLNRCYTGDLFTAKAKQIIANRTANNPNQPFFLFLSYDTPHGALQLPTVAYPVGNGAASGLQWIGNSGNMINTATGTIDSYRDPLYTGLGLGDVYERQGTVVTRIDRQVGDILQTVRDLGIANNTLVFFSSDNGPSDECYITGISFTPQNFQSYGPFEGMKRDVFEGGVRVPTVAWGPTRILANRTSNQLSQFHDWMATFLDFAGVERPARIDGVSLLPVLTGNGTQEQGIVYVEYDFNGSMPNYADFAYNGGTSRLRSQSVYMEGYKGIRNNIAAHTQNFKIFNLGADSKEGNNLAGTSAFFTGLQQRMKDRVLQLRMPDTSAVRAYDNEPVPTVTATSPINGVQVRTFEGTWNWVPNFERMQQIGTYVDSQINLARLSRTQNAGLYFTGYLSVPTAGNWTFYTTSDKGVIFKLHDKLVLDEDYNNSGSEISRTVNLQAGLHPYRVYYRTATTTPNMQLLWSGPGITKGPIAPARLFVESAVTGIRLHPPHIRPGSKVKRGRTADGRLRTESKGKSWRGNFQK